MAFAILLNFSLISMLLIFFFSFLVWFWDWNLSTSSIPFLTSNPPTYICQFLKFMISLLLIVIACVSLFLYTYMCYILNITHWVHVVILYVYFQGWPLGTGQIWKYGALTSEYSNLYIIFCSIIVLCMRHSIVLIIMAALILL